MKPEEEEEVEARVLPPLDKEQEIGPQAEPREPAVHAPF